MGLRVWVLRALLVLEFRVGGVLIHRFMRFAGLRACRVLLLAGFIGFTEPRV